MPPKVTLISFEVGERDGGATLLTSPVCCPTHARLSAPPPALRAHLRAVAPNHRLAAKSEAVAFMQFVQTTWVNKADPKLSIQVRGAWVGGGGVCVGGGGWGCGG